MSKFKIVSVLFASALMLTVAFGQVAKMDKNSTQGFTAMANVPPPDDGNRIFPVGVEYSLQLDPATQTLYAQMASTLTGYPNVPPDRTNYYSSVVGQAGYSINGWGGLVSNVQPNCYGNLVTVQVFVNLSSDTLGPATIVLSSYYFEQFQVNNDNTINYLGFLDPNATTGQQFEMCDF